MGFKEREKICEEARQILKKAGLDPDNIWSTRFAIDDFIMLDGISIKELKGFIKRLKEDPKSVVDSLADGLESGIMSKKHPLTKETETLYLEGKGRDFLLVVGDENIHATWVVKGRELPVSLPEEEKEKDFIISFEYIPGNYPCTTFLLKPYSLSIVEDIVRYVILSWGATVVDMPSEDTRFGADIAKIKAKLEKDF